MPQLGVLSGYWHLCATPTSLSLLSTHVQALSRGFQSFHACDLTTSSFLLSPLGTTEQVGQTREVVLSAAVLSPCVCVICDIYKYSKHQRTYRVP